jgi:hypothetical protein
MNAIKLFSSLIALSQLISCGQIVSSSPKAPPLFPDQSGISTDPNNNSSSGGSGQSGSPNHFGSTLGKYAFGVRVNRTLVAKAQSGDNQYGFIRTLDGISGPGAYYGVGLGNTGMIGLGVQFNHQPVSAFESLTFKAFTPAENCEDSYNAYVGVIIDLNCDDLNPEYLVVKTDNFEAKSRDTWNSYEIKQSDAAFRKSGSTGRFKTLAQLTRGHPKACFVAADSFDLGFRRDQKLAPFQIIHGDRIYFENSAVALDDIELKVAGASEREDFEL